MDKEKYTILIYKDLSGTISAEEKKELMRWLESDDENQNYDLQIRKSWELSGKYRPTFEIDEKADYQIVHQRIKEDLTNSSKTQSKRDLAQIAKNRIRWAWAAAILLLVTTVWVLTNDPNPQSELVQITTSTGEKTQITLEDGSEIWLNENSTLSYRPELLQGVAREVNLKGEAYFEVIPNSGLPFVVQTPNSEITVLGTSFNVRAFPEEEWVEVTVDEGLVQLESIPNSESILIKQNRRGLYDKNTGSVHELPVEHKNTAFWKSGTLVYNRSPLSQVLSDLELYFQIRTTLTDTAMQSCPITARFPQAEGTEVLRYVASAFQMELENPATNNFFLKNGVCN